MDEPTEDILSIKPGEVTVKATITHKRAHRIKNGNLMTDADIADNTGTTKVVWFSKQPKDNLIVGAEYIFAGHYQLKYGRLALQSPQYRATGEHPAMGLLALSPLILPARNYPAKKAIWANVPEWAGVAVFWLLVVGGVGLFIVTGNPQTSSSSSSSQDSRSVSHSSPIVTTQLPPAPSTITSTHNGIPEISTPSQADDNSKCTDVTSIDYDWSDDVLCTRPDGSQFYTNYAGGRAVDSSFKK